MHVISCIIKLHGTHVDSGTESDGLVGVDTLAELLAIEEGLQKLLHLGNTGRTTDQNNLINVGLLELGVFKSPLHQANSPLEKVSVQFLKTGTSKGLGEVDTVSESVYLYTDLVL